jgi:hypothetical protein
MMWAMGGGAHRCKVCTRRTGLHLNHGKLELICDEISTRATMLLQDPGLQPVSCSQATLLKM